jgi:DNA-binding GntR family transcriptional regulator
LIAFYEMISSGLQLFRRRNLRSEHQIEASVAEHEKILDAIKAGDAERAARVFERHVLGGKQRMLDSLPSGTSE